MPTWGELLAEIPGLAQQAEERNASGEATIGALDLLRRKYMAALAASTGRAVIVYATAWLNPRDGVGNALSVNLGDVQGFMEAVSNVEEKEVDLFLHSPGGSPDAAESIVEYLRTRFTHIRVVVPVAAMSAATMMALSADEIILGAHSQLGPIDPQLTVHTPDGPRSAPAQAIEDQFEMAKKELAADPGAMAAWLPILRYYGPGLLAHCDHQQKLGKTCVASWLAKYMFKDDAAAAGKAQKAAEWFSDFRAFGSHGRRVSRDDCRALDLRVKDLEEDGALQDAMLSVHHAVQHTFSQTPALKLIENHHGRSWIQLGASIPVRQGGDGGVSSGPSRPAQPRARRNQGGRKRRK